MVGENIVPGEYSDIHQTDLAPTISAILGLAPPTAAQGRILFEMLQMTETNQTLAQLSLARQRIYLAQAYLAQIQGLQAPFPNQLFADLTAAQTAFTRNNIDGAFQLALLAQKEADTRMTVARNHRIKIEQLLQLAAAIPVFLVWFIILWRRRGIHAGAVAIAAILTVVLYHALFQLQGYSYSVSSLQDFSEFPFEIARRTAVSLLVGGGLVLILLLLTNEGDWLTLLGTGYGFGMLVTLLFSLPLFWAFWQNGFTVDWRLPAILPAFWQITGLFEMMTAALLALLLPWPIMSLSLFIHLLRRRLSQARAKPEPDALPGLHL
jgi:hypothetical protein